MTEGMNPSYRWGLTEWYRDMSMINPSRSDFLIEVSGKRGFSPTEKGDYGIQMVPRQNKCTGAGVYCHGTVSAS
jgi:hypothetical protein